ncbi:MAG: MarR family EPS-associated transcriptional regulator [Erythrobacter sp.]
MTGRQNTLKEDTRFRVLRLLEANPNLSQRELAGAVGISTGSAHYLLSALIERGLVELGNFRAADDKRRYAYILTPKGLAEKTSITGRFLARKLEEYEALKCEIEELEAEFGSGLVSGAKDASRIIGREI